MQPSPEPSFVHPKPECQLLRHRSFNPIYHRPHKRIPGFEVELLISRIVRGAAVHIVPFITIHDTEVI